MRLNHSVQLLVCGTLFVGSFVAATAQEHLRIGLVLPGLSSQVIAEIDKAARSRAAEIGNVEVLTTASYDGEEQAKGIENYIAQKVDVIIYDSINAAAVGPAVVKANEANIPVIAIISPASSGKYVTLITPDFKNMGKRMGLWTAGKLGKDGVVAYLEGNPSDAAGIALTEGFQAGLAEGGITKVVASQPTDWDRERALAVSTDILTAHPNLQAIGAAVDELGLVS